MNPGATQQMVFKNYPGLAFSQFFYSVSQQYPVYRHIDYRHNLFSLAAAFIAKIKSKATPSCMEAFDRNLFTIESLMIPLYLMSFTLGLTDTRIGVLIPTSG